MRLYVGNLPYQTTDSDLRTLFESCGTVKEVKVISDNDTGRSKGFAFVEMSNEDEANKAIFELNGYLYGGRSLKISEAQEKHRPGSNGAGRAAPMRHYR